MSEYTPTTEDVKDYYVQERLWVSTNIPTTSEQGTQEFNRWLQEEKAKVWEGAVDCLSAHWEDKYHEVVADLEVRNPYRKP